MVLARQKISDTRGNFTGVLDDEDYMGVQIAAIRDLDGDGVEDIAVGAAQDDDGGLDRGAVWIMFLNADGTVKSHQKISSTDGNFTGVLDDSDKFARVASLGDLDGDGYTDLAVGAPFDDDGGSDRGAVWILFLNGDGTVKSHQKISDTSGGFTGGLLNSDEFGWSVTALRDLDGDHVPELAVGAPFDDDGGGVITSNFGAVWILFLNRDGTVKAHQKISALAGGFTGTLDAVDHFGHAVSELGDLDQDGVQDLAVGAFSDDDGGPDRGAVWVLFLNPDGTVKAHQKISSLEGGFTGTLDDNDVFSRVFYVHDVDGDGVQDLAVGAPGDDDGFAEAGAVWILFLNRDGTVKGHQKISATQGNGPPGLDGNDQFGWSGTWMRDVDGDGKSDIAVGAFWDDDGGGLLGYDRGAVYILSLDGPVLTAAPAVDSRSAVSLASYPNPVRNGTALQYALPSAGPVRLLILDARGARVATLVDGEQEAGSHSSSWSGRNDAGVPAAAGIYFARLETAHGTAVQKIAVVR